MKQRWLDRSERWFRFLLRFYPVDFRDQMGDALVEAYRDRCRAALQSGGLPTLAAVWLRALTDSLINGTGERMRPATGWRRGGNWGRDMELATRRLLRAPGFALAMIGTLTLGLGAFAVVATVVHKVLLAPLPYRDPDDLYFVWRDYTWVQFGRGWLGGTDIVELAKSGAPAVEDAAGLLRYRMTLSGADDVAPVEIPVMGTSPNLFDLLGVQPMLGRGFAPNEVGPDRPAVLVLTYDLWRRLGRNQSIIGSELRLNGTPYTAIGVMPEQFNFLRNSSLGPPQQVDAYIPLNVHLAETSPDGGAYGGLIRARKGTPPEALAAVVDRVGSIINVRDFSSQGLKLYPVGIKADLVARVRPALVILGLAGVFLVLVLMVNLATLLLARAAQREQEFAVSRALGANPIALVRATLLEGGLLGLMGGGLGALGAVWGIRFLVGLAPMDLPRREAIAVDWKLALMVTGVGLLSGLIASSLPATWAARASLSSLLRNAAVRGGGGHGRMRRAMVVVQVAMSVVLLTSGGLVVRSFERLLRADPGFNPEGVLAFRVPMPTQFVPDSTAAYGLQQRIESELAALPGVIGVSAADALPISSSANQTAISIPGAPGNTGERDHDRPLIDIVGVKSGYFEVMGIRLLAGPGFSPARRKELREAVIDNVLAEFLFPNGDPLGAKIPFGDPDTLTVVGVIQQARIYDVHQDSRGQVYVRADDWGYQTLNYVVRTGRNPELLIPEARAVVRRADPRLALSDERTMKQMVRDSLRQQRISAVLIAAFSLGALILAAMGLFGVVASAVNRRQHELAVRLALGAEYGRVLRLVLGEGARLILIGVLIGVPGTWYAAKAIRSLLVGVSPADPLTLAAVGLGLGVVALAACYLPARRVLAIEPARSLRDE